MSASTALNGIQGMSPAALRAALAAGGRLMGGGVAGAVEKGAAENLVAVASTANTFRTTSVTVPTTASGATGLAGSVASMAADAATVANFTRTAGVLGQASQILQVAMIANQVYEGDTVGAAGSGAGLLASMVTAGAMGTFAAGPVGTFVGVAAAGMVATPVGESVARWVQQAPERARQDMNDYMAMSRQAIESPQGQHVVALLGQDPRSLSPAQLEMRQRIEASQANLANASSERAPGALFSPQQLAAAQYGGELANAIRQVTRDQITLQDRDNQRVGNSPQANALPDDPVFNARLSQVERDVTRADPIAPAGADFSNRQMAEFRRNRMIADHVRERTGQPALQGPSLDSPYLGPNQSVTPSEQVAARVQYDATHGTHTAPQTAISTELAPPSVGQGHNPVRGQSQGVDVAHPGAPSRTPSASHAEMRASGARR